MLIGVGLLVTAQPGRPSAAMLVAGAPVTALGQKAVDDTATATLPPTATATTMPTATDTATATPVPPTYTLTLSPTATRRPPTATPSRTPRPPTATPAQVTPVASVQAAELTADESNLLAMVNAERARAGLPPLVLDPVLQSVAHARAADMIARKFYSHVDPATGQLAARAMLLDLGVRYVSSENFYSNRPYDAGFVGRAMQWLMGDAVHRANLLLRYWNSVGVGVAGTPGGIAVVVQEFGAQ